MMAAIPVLAFELFVCFPMYGLVLRYLGEYGIEPIRSTQCGLIWGGQQARGGFCPDNKNPIPIANVYFAELIQV